MRIRLLREWGQFKVDEVIQIGYTMGANLCYAGLATEVSESAVNRIEEKKSIQFPPNDKMVRGTDKARRKGRKPSKKGKKK